jgi:hypothetical protein
MVYVGQLECYEKCEEIIEKTNGIAIGHTQIQRVVDVYGEALAPTISGTRTLSPVQAKEVLYAEVDGSMLFTRDESWKEVKVGRIFKSSDCIDPNGEASWIRHSQYLSYIESSKFFTTKMEDLLESYGTIKERLVFINDGATWIRQWIEDAYPDAISILDFYHAMEHLHLFVKDFFGDEAKSKKWTATQKKLLLDSRGKASNKKH